MSEGNTLENRQNNGKIKAGEIGFDSTLISWLHKGLDPETGGIYPKSINSIGNSWVFMTSDESGDALVATGSVADRFSGENVCYGSIQGKKAPLTHENACVLREAFPFTAPVPVLRRKRSFGVGDRLGLACPGHIRVFDDYTDISPVLAQQSIRELNLLERTYEDVLDCVTFAVYKYGFKRGFGADGDHLKHREDVEYALSLGFSMITLDCSEYIRGGVDKMSDADVDVACPLDSSIRDEYLGKTFELEDGISVFISEQALKRSKLIYGRAVEFAAEIYNEYIADKPDSVDFEISIDETMTPTEPAQHFFVARELEKRGVRAASLAPRFCGDFQKGIDYIGDIAQFENEIRVHAAIARKFGYKLSIHSGSDKFSIYRYIGKYTRGNFHIKTCGTNWLEAMRIVAEKEPALYRKIHAHALSRFDDAIKLYHIAAEPATIPTLETMEDAELPGLFNNNNVRQLIHITYGYIMTDKDKSGNYMFKDRLYKLWDTEKAAYSNALYAHISRHVGELYKSFSEE